MFSLWRWLCLTRQVVQVRGAATWGGALALCEPHSDLLALLAAAGAQIHVAGAKKSHVLSVEQLVAGPYLSSIVQGSEIITSLVSERKE